MATRGIVGAEFQLVEFATRGTWCRDAMGFGGGTPWAIVSRRHELQCRDARNYQNAIFAKFHQIS